MASGILKQIATIGESAKSREEYLQRVVEAIDAAYDLYSWVGFYFLADGQLHVGPYVGPETPHAVIDVNSGICGAAVREENTIVVDDVNADPRFLACSLTTRSEIVVPIRVKGKIIGEIDIDSDTPAAFTAEDRRMLEEIADMVGQRLAAIDADMGTK